MSRYLYALQMITVSLVIVCHHTKRQSFFSSNENFYDLLSWQLLNVHYASNSIDYSHHSASLF